jgi:hypothetical protein
VGRVTPHRFIEKVMDMTKIIAPPQSRNIADIVTYGIVGCIFVAFVIAYIYSLT